MDRENRKVMVFTKPSRTKQSFKKECDINVIMKKFSKMYGHNWTDMFAGYQRGNYGDFSNIGDYREAMETVNNGYESFMRLPAQLRKRFNNNPAQFLDFCNDSRNLDEMISLGLATKKEDSVTEKKE